MPDVFPREAPEPRALLGWDGTAFRVVAVDAQGNVVLAPGGVNLRQFVAVWRYTGVGSAGAGNIDLDSVALVVPDLVVVENAVCWIDAGSAASINIAVFDGATVYAVARLANPALQVVLVLTSPLVLTAGELLRFRAFGVGAGTGFQARAVGYYVRT